jgi:hypothetical protein
MSSHKTKSRDTFSKVKIIKNSRKEHTCSGCKKQIPVKSSYTRVIGVDESNSHYGNDFFSVSWHAECLADHQEYVRDNLRRQG